MYIIGNPLWSLILQQDQTHNTLNFAIAIKNKVAQMRMNLENIPIPNMTHLHKQIREVIYGDLLKATLKVSTLQHAKSKVKN